MVRITTTLCFTVATLFGPGACCCSLNDFLGVRHSVAPLAVTTKAKPRRACCEKLPGYSAATDQGPAKSSAPERCPCQGTPDRLDAVPLQAKAADDAMIRHILDGWKVGLELGIHSPVVKAGMGAMPGPKSGSRSFVSTDEILNVMHILRC